MVMLDNITTLKNKDTDNLKYKVLFYLLKLLNNYHELF